MAFALLCEEEEAYEELQNEVPNLIVKELEKIKSEIRHKSYIQEEYGDISVNTVMWIIDKHISELKGENNEKKMF